MLRQLLITGLLLGCALSVQAENRALLIGATSYEKSLFNLSGIDKDLVTMTQFSKLLGYQDQQIRVLEGADVTEQNVQREFDTFLSKDVGPTDSILIYYSGHGVQIRDTNEDEDDGRDEALTMYDLALEKTGGYSGIITDDQLQLMLNKLPSRNIMLVVDACHSGTVTRNLTTQVELRTLAFGETYQVKALPYRDKPTAVSRTIGQPINVQTNGVIALSAAQDDEQALATTMGSTFTLSLFSALQQLRDEATPQSMIEFTKSNIREKIDADSVFTPNISGDLTLADRPFRVIDAVQRGEVYWQQLENVVRQTSKMPVTSVQSRYTEDQEISLSVELPFDGYLNIVLVDTHDNAIVLFPNSFDDANFFTQGTHTLPGSQEYGWFAQAPWGKNLLVALHSAEPLNLTGDNLNQGRDGVTVFPFVPPSPVDMYKLASAFSQPDATKRNAAAVYFETCKTNDSCWQ